MRLSKKPDRIFIDATYTICSGKSSGIERVVRNLMRECAEMASGGELPRPQVVVSHGGRFFELSDVYRKAFINTAAMQANVLRATPKMYRLVAEQICRATQSRTMQKWLLPKPGHLGVFKLAHTVREHAIFQTLSRKLPPLEARPGDLFILPDAYWVNRLRSSVWPAAASARQRGAMVAGIIYDLIPLTHPEFVGLKRRDAFQDYLLQAAMETDLLVTISNTVLEQLREFIDGCPQIPIDRRPILRSFQLGAELKSASGTVRPSVEDLFSRSKTPYLMVATFDPRKNHHYLLDAFEMLWDSGEDVELCLVGRFGSRCDDLIQRISQHAQLGKRLHLFVDLSDAELQHCYKHARGVIFPSIVEGFGLPIVESLWFGNKTFVSDTPIHREVGDQDCCYFSLQCPSSLAGELRTWEKVLNRETPDLPTRRPVSWRESSRQLLSHCIEIHSQQLVGKSQAESETFRHSAA